MATIRDLFTFYLKAEHLRGQSVVVHIESCTVDQVFNPHIKRDEPKLLIRFHGKKLALCANKTQAAALEKITKTDDYEKWVGQTIMLTPTPTERAGDTITITAPPKPVDPPTPATKTSQKNTTIKEEPEGEDEDEEDYGAEDPVDLRYG